MTNEKIKTITFIEANEPEIISIINELAALEDRKPHDSARRLILDTGTAKVAFLRDKLKMR